MKKIKLMEGDLEETYLSELEHGDYVKVWNGKEKFWVMITAIKNNLTLYGIISSRLKLSSYTHGDIISFHTKHIFEYMKLFI